MNNIVTKITLLLFVITSSNASAEQKNKNHLNWVEVSHNKLSVQIMFDFSQKINFIPTITKEKNQLLLSFPGMTTQTFQALKVVPKLTQLKAAGFLQSVECAAQSNGSAYVNLTLEFAPYRTMPPSSTDSSNKQKNRFLIKWSTLEQPYRLIIDIFPKENLEKIAQKDAILLHATNNTQQYDVTPPPLTTQLTSKQQRIIIDPGHGGCETGAKGYFGLLEKDIALDIAKRVHKMLKVRGYKSLLTRSEDKEMSLLQRAHLAHQLQGDLFVSIHVNSSGHMHSSEQAHNSAWGIETFFFNNTPLHPRKGQTGFGFINLKDNKKLIDLVQKQLNQTQNHSQLLAQKIQNGILSTLDHFNIQVQDRGIKPEKFRVFIQSSMPAALAEVGFLTNEQEAKRLNRPGYRNMLAQGICNGIINFTHALIM